MTPDAAHWQRLSALFDAAVDLDAAGRAAAVRAAADEDPALVDALARMLTADDATSAVDAGAAAWLGADGAADPGADDDADLHDDVDGDDGIRLGAWRLGARIGRGGMGTVHAAERVATAPGDARDAQRAAIKRLHRRWDGSLQAQRFLQERRILAALSHPNIPQLLDHGLDEDGRPWFALEFVDGLPLVAWADAQRLTLRARIELLRQVCAAVQHAHARFVVHRDLKPANVLVDADGRARVLDFGVAKRLDDPEGATATGLFAGFTPEYAAPEQVSGGAVTAATDVHALGMLLYELLTGRLPHAIDTADLRATAETIVTQAAGRLEDAITLGSPDEVDTRLRERATDVRAFRRFVRGDLWRIVQTALAKEPSRRYQSVQAFSDDLQRFLDGRTVSVTGDTWRYRAGKFVRRNRWSVGMAAAALVALLAGTTGIALQTREARTQARIASAEAARAESSAARARAEVQRVQSQNEFMRSVFTGAAPFNSGTSQVTLRQALDTAVKQIDAGDHEDPELRARFLLSAATSYDDFAEPEEAERLVRRALAIQERELPDAKEVRGRALANLAWLRMAYEPAQSVAWAEEALRLHKASDPVSMSGLMEATSVLASAYYVADRFDEALEMMREGRRQMRADGLPEDYVDVITSWSNEAVVLAGLKRYPQAETAHRTAIALRAKAFGPDAMVTALERTYLGYTLNRAQRYADARAELAPALRILEKELPADHDSVHLARYGLARADEGVGRTEAALANYATVHAFARTHGFQNRQAAIGGDYARALARAGRCREALALLDELATRKIALEDGATPLAGTACTTAGTR